MPNYICWTKHGETGVLEDEQEEEDNTILDYAQYSCHIRF
jgi:membrane-bound inhibitor of C-type lysozyme